MTAINLFSALSPIATIITLVGLLGVLTILFVLKERDSNKKILSYFVLSLMLSLGIIMISDIPLKRHLKLLCANSNKSVKVLLDDKTIANGREFMCRLASYDESKGLSGSQPTIPINVIISYEDHKLRFILKRDSRDKNLYWIFYPDYTFRSAIGFISIDLDSWPLETD